MNISHHLCICWWVSKTCYRKDVLCLEACKLACDHNLQACSYCSLTTLGLKVKSTKNPYQHEKQHIFIEALNDNANTKQKHRLIKLKVVCWAQKVPNKVCKMDVCTMSFMGLYSPNTYTLILLVVTIFSKSTNKVSMSLWNHFMFLIILTWDSTIFVDSFQYVELHRMPHLSSSSKKSLHVSHNLFPRHLQDCD